MDQWIVLKGPKTISELYLGKGWVERSPWAVCLFYKLSGSVVLSYLSLCKEITGMKVVKISFYNYSLDILHLQIDSLSLHFIQEVFLYMFNRINEPRIRNDGMMSKISFLYFSTHLMMNYSST